MSAAQDKAYEKKLRETYMKMQMAMGKNRVSAPFHGDTSHLPCSPGDAARIALTGELSSVLRPSHPENPTGFNLETQLGRFVLSSKNSVPEFDPRGHPSAESYEAWRKANHSRIGIPSNTYSIKGRGMVACLSDLERRFLSYCEMNPMVLEIRSQYPEWDRKKSASALASDEKLLETDIMTIDFVLTLQSSHTNKVRYHAVSCKTYKELYLPKTIRRHAREVEFLRLWGCTHQIVTEFFFSKYQDVNNQRLLQFMLHTKNIYELIPAAYKFASLIRRAKGSGSLDELIAWAAKQLGLALDAGYTLLGVAHYVGFMVCDHSKELLPETQLDFNEESRNFLPRIDPNLISGATNDDE